MFGKIFLNDPLRQVSLDELDKCTCHKASKGTKKCDQSLVSTMIGFFIMSVLCRSLSQEDRKPETSTDLVSLLNFVEVCCGC